MGTPAAASIPMKDEPEPTADVESELATINLLASRTEPGIVMVPKIHLVREPATSLDPKGAERRKKLFRKLKCAA